MTDQQHPITPPPKLVEQWVAMLEHHTDSEVFSEASRWGADQELGACCAWLIANDNPRWALALQEGRRPKPPSLAEQALKALDKMNAPLGNVTASRCDTIRRALERLQELEKGNE